MDRISRAITGLCLLLGCSSPPSPAPASTLPAIQGCSGGPVEPHPFSPEPAGSFAHSRSALIAQATSPAHAMQDILTTVGAPIFLGGKFAYGTISKDLEDELVRFYLDTCEGWKLIGEGKTDSDGRARVPLTAQLAPGSYGVRAQVVGDGSLAEATLRIYPKGAHLVVFDIDGTLTTGDDEILKDIQAELFEPILKGDYVPKAYPFGVELTQAEAARGEAIVYLSGRPYWLTRQSRDWLSKLGYAPGTLHLTDSNAEAIPSESGVGAYKLAYLQELLALGFVIDTAYGNATTDISAYLGAGVPPEQIYIIGPNAGQRGTKAVKDSWEAELSRVKSLGKVGSGE